MAYEVRFTQSAQKDLRSIYDYISQKDSQERAEYVAREIIRAALTLQELAERGVHPPELLRSGKPNYRQIFFKPYRIPYRIRGNTVFVAVIADGRRNMASLLARRLRSS